MKNKSNRFIDARLDNGSLQELLTYFPPEATQSAEALLRHLVNNGDAWDRLGEARAQIRTDAYSDAYKSGTVVL